MRGTLFHGRCRSGEAQVRVPESGRLVKRFGYAPASAAAMVVNKPWRLVPIAVTATRITTEISPAMRPYSIAVTPASSFTKRTNKFFIWLSVDVHLVRSRRR